MKKQKTTIQYTLAELTQGLDVKIIGDPDCVISGVTTIQRSEKGRIAFLMNPLYKKHLAETKASAVILTESDAEDCPVNAVISRDPYFTYAKIAAYFEYKRIVNEGVHPTAVLGKACEIHPTASIGAYCVLGDFVKIGANVVLGAHCTIGEYTEIGDNTRLDASVILYHHVKLGNSVSIGAGSVLGSEGFGLAKHKGVWHKVPQLGRVIIEDDVEIGANCAIDRGAIDDTVIEKGARLDNLVQIGHNVRIGEYTALAGCVGVAGSAVIGKNCLIGGAAGIAGHITLADNVMVTGMSAITRTIREPGIYSSGVGGVVPNQEWRKTSARVHKLDNLVQRVKTLEFALQELIERKET
jgi:UDP-3-O-[3-hydroxymyristoyl] glucosamine N-acyltransferase